jgi:hypothetical protein
VSPVATLVFVFPRFIQSEHGACVTIDLRFVNQENAEIVVVMIDRGGGKVLLICRR